MKRILVTGACGQIGTELVPALRARFGDENVVAAGHTTPLSEEMKAGPSDYIDVTKYDEVDAAFRNYGVDTVFHMASMLSALRSATAGPPTRSTSTGSTTSSRPR